MTRLTPNGDSIWTVPIGDGSVAVTSVASSGAAFVVGAINSGATEDLDPGPSIDLLFGDVAFVSRFKF